MVVEPNDFLSATKISCFHIHPSIFGDQKRGKTVKEKIIQLKTLKMSSTKVQHPVKIDNPEEKLVQTERNRKEMHRRATFNASNVQNKKKHDNESRKSGRKRANSNAPGFSKFFPPHKRRKKEEQLTLPTKFLLGGNIYDPLNLNSLQDEEINRAMNAFTPKSSPLPTPKHRKGAIEVIIPPNLHDPLNLACCDDDAEYEQQLISPFKKTARKQRSNRMKKKRNSSSGCSSVETSVTEPSTENKPAENLGENSELAAETEPIAETSTASRNLDLPLKKENTKDKSKFRNKFELKDKIVSPVIPQSRGWTRPHGHRPGKQHKKAVDVMPKFTAKNGMYRYGNYTRYYGYRNPGHAADARLKHLAEFPSLFAGKDVLDIGCNIGHVALSVARDFGARSVVGLDIDRKLVDIARNNVRHYVNCSDSPAPDGTKCGTKFFPISMPIVLGPLADIGGSPATHSKFPHNITFVQGNYVLDSDTLLETEQTQFDVILCLSITKWLHLNWGDAGLKQAFRRMFIQLRPGGKLILEAQSWDSYKKRRNLTETHFQNYQAIKFFPQKFTQYLLSEVGFHKVDTIATPVHPSKGFQRPIQMFTKGIFSSSYSAASTPFYAAPAGRTKAPVYTSVVVSTREPDDDDDIDMGDKSAPRSEGDAVFESPHSDLADREDFLGGRTSTSAGFEAADENAVSGTELDADASENDVVSDEFGERETEVLGLEVGVVASVGRTASASPDSEGVEGDDAVLPSSCSDERFGDETDVLRTDLGVDASDNLAFSSSDGVGDENFGDKEADVSRTELESDLECAAIASSPSDEVVDKESNDDSDEEGPEK